MTSRTEITCGYAKMVGAAALAAALFVCAPSAMAQEAEKAPQFSFDLGNQETDTAWFEAFTLSMNDPLSINETGPNTTTFELQSGTGRWGLTVGVEDNPDNRFQIEDTSLEAFINVDRFRFSGELRFTRPEEDLLPVPVEPDERQPEIKFESTLRF